MPGSPLHGSRSVSPIRLPSLSLQVGAAAARPLSPVVSSVSASSVEPHVVWSDEENPGSVFTVETPASLLRLMSARNVLQADADKIEAAMEQINRLYMVLRMLLSDMHLGSLLADHRQKREDEKRGDGCSTDGDGSGKPRGGTILATPGCASADRSDVVGAAGAAVASAVPGDEKAADTKAAVGPSSGNNKNSLDDESPLSAAVRIPGMPSSVSPTSESLLGSSLSPRNRSQTGAASSSLTDSRGRRRSLALRHLERHDSTRSLLSQLTVLEDGQPSGRKENSGKNSGASRKDSGGGSSPWDEMDSLQAVYERSSRARGTSLAPSQRVSIISVASATGHAMSGSGRRRTLSRLQDDEEGEKERAQRQTGAALEKLTALLDEKESPFPQLVGVTDRVRHFWARLTQTQRFAPVEEKKHGGESKNRNHEQKQLPEDIDTICARVKLTGREMHLYKELFLFLYCVEGKATEVYKQAQPVDLYRMSRFVSKDQAMTMRLLRLTIMHLRELDVTAMERRHATFLNRIDNLLAYLMFHPLMRPRHGVAAGSTLQDSPLLRASSSSSSSSGGSGGPASPLDLHHMLEPLMGRDIESAPLLLGESYALLMHADEHKSVHVGTASSSSSSSSQRQQQAMVDALHKMEPAEAVAASADLLAAKRAGPASHQPHGASGRLVDKASNMLDEAHTFIENARCWRRCTPVRQVCAFGVAMVFFCLLGLLTIWGYWYLVSEDLLEDALDRLGDEVQVRIQQIMHDIMSAPPVVTGLTSAAVSAGDIYFNFEESDVANATGQYYLNQDYTDRLLLKLLEVFQVSSVYLITATQFSGAFWLEVPESEPFRRTSGGKHYGVRFRSFNLPSQDAPETSECVEEYGVDWGKRARDPAQRIELGCLPGNATSSTERPWHRFLEGFNATHLDWLQHEFAGWTPVYCQRPESYVYAPDARDQLGMTFFRWSDSRSVLVRDADGFPLPLKPPDNTSAAFPPIAFAVNLELSYLSLLLSDVRMPEGGVVYVTDVDGLLLASGASDEVFTPADDPLDPATPSPGQTKSAGQEREGDGRNDQQRRQAWTTNLEDVRDRGRAQGRGWRSVGGALSSDPFSSPASSLLGFSPFDPSAPTRRPATAASGRRRPTSLSVGKASGGLPSSPAPTEPSSSKIEQCNSMRLHVTESNTELIRRSAHWLLATHGSFDVPDGVLLANRDMQLEDGFSVTVGAVSVAGKRVVCVSVYPTTDVKHELQVRNFISLTFGFVILAGALLFSYVTYYGLVPRKRGLVDPVRPNVQQREHAKHKQRVSGADYRPLLDEAELDGDSFSVGDQKRGPSPSLSAASQAACGATVGDEKKQFASWKAGGVATPAAASLSGVHRLKWADVRSAALEAAEDQDQSAALLCWMRSPLQGAFWWVAAKLTARRYRRSVLLFIALALCLLFAILWVVWAVGTGNLVDDHTNELIDDLVSRLFSRLEAYLGGPMAVNELNLSRVNASRFDLVLLPQTVSKRAVDATLEYFYHTFTSFQTASTAFGLAQWIYLGTETGIYLGAGVTHGRNTTLAVRDPFTKPQNCYVHLDVTGEGHTDYIDGHNFTDFHMMQLGTPNCGYDPRARSWYTSAVSSRAPGWTRMYVGVSGKLEITAYAPILNRTGSVNGVFGADLQLEFISSYLNSSLAKSLGEGGRVLVLDELYRVIASSTMDWVFQPVGSDDLFPLPSRDLKDDDLREAAIFLENYLYDRESDDPEDRYSSLHATRPVKLPRGLTAPLTFVKRLTTTSGLNWAVLILANKSNFYGASDDHATLSFVLTVCSATVIFVLAISGWRMLTKQTFPVAQKKAWQVLGAAQLNTSILQSHMAQVEDDVMQACGQSFRRVQASRMTPLNEFAWRERRPEDEVHGGGDAKENGGRGVRNKGETPFLLAVASAQPVDYDSFSVHCAKRAVQHIRQSKNNKNILTVCQLERLESPWPLRLYSAYTHYISTVFMLVIVTLHCVLAFLEPVNQRLLKKDGVHSVVLVVEGVCIFLELAYAALSFVFTYGWASLNLLHPSDTLFKEYSTAALVFMIAIDWVLSFTVRIRFEYIFPMRPVLLICTSDHLRKAVVLFFKAVVKARHVLILFVIMLIVSGLMGVILFKDNLNVDSSIEQNNFTDVIRGLVTAFVFITLADNYTAMVYQAVSFSTWNVIYFIVVAIFGFLVLTAMAVSMFEEAYRDYYRRELLHNRLYSRTGALAAFVLLDLDGGGSLTRSEFENFVKEVAPNATALQIRFLFDYMDHACQEPDSSGDQQLSINEFVAGLEQIIYLLKYKDPPRPDEYARWRVGLQKVVLSESFRMLGVALLLLHITVLSLYGLVSHEKEHRLNSLALIFVLFVVFEVFLRIVAFGAHRFWWYTEGRADLALSHLQEREARGEYIDPAAPLGEGIKKPRLYGRERRFTNRFDFCLIVLCLLGILTAETGGVARRTFLALPILRLFTLSTASVHLVHTLIKIIPMFISLFALIAVVMYMYAVFGLYIFSDRLDTVFQADAPEGDFDSLATAMLTLFQLFLGDSLFDIMYPSISATRWSAALYFITFIALITVLLTNLFFGVLLNTFSALSSKRNLSARQVRIVLSK